MITPTQMRAARAMLDVSQGHVAEFLGIAANTLSKIESGQSDISMSRNAEIQRFYEREGIAFTDNDGVRWAKNEVVTYSGRSGFLDFMDDVYRTMSSGGGEILVNNVDEKEFLKWGADEAENHIERMNAVKDLSSKILIEEGNTDTVNATYIEYRQISKEKFGEIPLYIFQNKTALIVFSEEDVEIYVIDQPQVTTFFRKRFMNSWDQAKKI
ncbi:MAG: helix-turn-helix transcriptional regulator [Pseudomonadota bacterium]